MGASTEVIEAHKKEQGENIFEVWKENWEIVQMFLRLNTQWVVTNGAVVGINYQSMDFLFKLYKVEDPLSVFSGLQIMEDTALPLLNEKVKNK